MSDNILDQIHLNRHKFIHLEKDPYLSPNPIHSNIFWQRIYVAQNLISRYVRTKNQVLDFGTNQGVIIPFLVQNFKQINSVELTEIRTERKQVQELQNMLKFFNLTTDTLKFIDIDPADQKLEMIKDQTQDCIIATDVLEHVPNLPILLNTFKRVLAPEGVIIVSIPLEHVLYRFGVWVNNLLFKMGTDRSFHVNDAAEIDQLLKENFQVIETRNLWGFFRFYVLKARQ